METTQCDNDLCFHKLNEEKKVFDCVIGDLLSP